MILAVEQWTGNTLSSKDRRKCEEIVTNYWLGPVLKYMDKLFVKVNPDFNLFVAHIDGNVLNKCRCASTLYRFDSKKTFVRWYNYYASKCGKNMSTTDIKIIYDVCDRYDFHDFVSALGTAGVKNMSYVSQVLNSMGHKNRLLRKPVDIGDKKAQDVTDAASKFAAKLEEKDIKKSYEHQ